MSLNHGSIWWSELMTHDVPAALKYYEDVCGWAFDAMSTEEGDYNVAIVHGRPTAGITEMGSTDEKDGRGPYWFTYVAVDNVDAAMEQTRFAGGEIVRMPIMVPGVGRVGIVRDPSGAEVGLMTPTFPTDALVAEDAPTPEIDFDEDNFPI